MTHPRPRTATRVLREDSGVIAIVVALSVSTFLLGFAALAVDMGMAYTRKAELRSIADRLALAGAKGLPEIGLPKGALDQIDKTLVQICRDGPMPGVCPDGKAPAIAWAVDGNRDNGEVTFFADADGDGRYRAAERVASSSEKATALRVELPKSVIEFGLAGAFGRDSAIIQRAASSRVGTPLAGGVLPFALTPADLRAGQFCVSDPGASGLPPVPAPTGPVTLDILNVIPGGVIYGREGETPLQIALTVGDGAPLGGPGTLVDVTFHLSNTADAVTAVPGVDGRPDTPTTTHFTVTLPTGQPTSVGTIWATGTLRPLIGLDVPFITSTVDSDDTNAEIRYSGLPSGEDGLCSAAPADRGFVKLNRPGGINDLTKLTRNLRSGPTVKLYPAEGLLGTIGDTVTCAATRLVSATSCLSTVRNTAISTALTRGLLTASGNTPGRLVGDCGNGTTGSHGRGGVDDSRLFQDSGFVNLDGHGSTSLLKDRITGTAGSTAADPGDRGWITSKVLRCPRMAVMPVVDRDSSVGPILGQEITSFRYVWIDNEDDVAHRGLGGDTGTVTSFRGYVVDPGYLNEVVAGSPVVGPYLGPDMPREALLITDLG